jgi:hypothetical protein
VRPSPGFLVVLPLYLAMSMALGFMDHHSRAHTEKAYVEYMPEVLSGQAGAPARYRVLAPTLYDWLMKATGSQPENGWLVFRFLGLVGVFASGHLLFRTWFSTGGAVAGNAIVAALLPLTFTVSWGHPDHFVELALFALGCACAVRRWFVPFLAVLVLATLNRETGFLLVVFFAGVEGISAPAVRRLGIAAVTWAAVYAGLRWRLGFVPYDPWQVGPNLGFLFEWPVTAYQRDLYYRAYAWLFVPLLIAPVIAIARTWTAQPRFVRVGVGLALPMFLVIGFLFSSVMEPRIFTPLLPVLATGMLFALFEPESRSRV